MVFVKGQSGNPKGRAKGVKIQKTILWEEMGEYLVKEGTTKYMEYLKQLDPVNYLKRYEAVIEYFKPKLARTEVTGPDGGPLEVVNKTYTVKKASDGKANNNSA